MHTRGSSIFNGRPTVASSANAKPLPATTSHRVTSSEPVDPGVAVVMRYEPGQTIFYQGDQVRFFMRISSGTARAERLLVDGRRQILAFPRAGDFLGPAGLDTCGYTLEPITDMTVTCYSRALLVRMMQADGALRREVVQAMSSQLSFAQDLLILLGRKRPLEKLATFLVMTAQARAHGEDLVTEVFLPMSRQDMADYLGMSEETVSRCFTRLRRGGLIALPDAKRVVYRDMPGLRRIADGLTAAEHGSSPA